jgi:site-specific recombinase XerD
MLSVIDTYLLVKESEGRAKSTIYEYRLYLSAFAAHCNKPLAEVTNTDIAAWVVGERAKGLADASILCRVKSLRVFFNWCVANDILVKSPLKMKNPRIRRTHPRIATVTSIAALLNLPCKSWLDYRNRALIHLLYDTGLRIGEARTLLVAHIDHARRLVYVPPGKDGESRVTPFTPACSQAILDYLAARPKGKHEQWLFFGGKGKGFVAPLKYNGARQIMERCCQQAGIPYVNPHSIRHLFATRALNNGMRVEIVSKILGHNSVDLTLSVYAKLLTETIQREYDAWWEAL